MQGAVSSGRKVIAIDLNPLSRTAQVAQISIVDELTRVVDALDRQLADDRDLSPGVLQERLSAYDNRAVLDEAVLTIRNGFGGSQTAAATSSAET